MANSGGMRERRIISLKNRLGRVPYLLDFYENEEIDPLVIIKEYKTYQTLLEAMEKERYIGRMTEKEHITVEYLSKTVLSGTRPYELEILKRVLRQEEISIENMEHDFQEEYGYAMDSASFENAISVLQGEFVSKDEKYQRYCHMDIIHPAEGRMLRRVKSYADQLINMEFRRQINDIVMVGLRRYQEKYAVGRAEGSPFVLYEKYSRRDVCLLMNCGKDLSATMYGMKRIRDDVFIFVTYHKVEVADEGKNYADGKPDYADEFEDSMTFRWDSQIGRSIDSSYIGDVTKAKRKHLLVKKNDAETSFYYMGQFDITDMWPAKKKDNQGKERDITKFEVKMHHAVREDLLRYLQSNLEEENA